MKSERLKKLEQEHNDLQNWLDLGLVPKKDLEKHKIEIETILRKMEDEKGRLQHLKETGDLGEYVAPKRKDHRSALEAHTITDAGSNDTDSGIEMETESFENETTVSGDTETGVSDKTLADDDDDPFSDKNRWRRGILEDPDSDSW